ncbi:hypothetical protein KI387_041524 [Taxus chinensis]|uniref:Probable purine permease n=1 Tax=Taxus chinensis TaxID=29808 RepID=A0AA38F5M6_TAXCH|nr:hypothetical protein KI387_041524 [Taxus chinensis]
MEKKSLLQWTMLMLSCASLSIGVIAGPLLAKFYFRRAGGNRAWLPAFLQTAGWPLLLIPIWISSCYNKKQGCHFQTVHVTLKLFIASFGIGMLIGMDNTLYSWGLRYLPLSTSAMVFATQLGFNAVFGYLIVRQKFTPFSINAIILLTFGTSVLSFNGSSDRPEGVSQEHYVLGFILTASAAGLYGLILPLIELTYRETSLQITYTLVMEMQLIMSFSASIVCTIGMVVYKDIPAMVREANASQLGQGLYYTSLLACAVCWQLFFIGVFGVIFLSNSLLSGVIIAFYIPVNQMLAVFVYDDEFDSGKAMAMGLAFWGFVSYLYGEYRSYVTQVENHESSLSDSESASLREDKPDEMDAV